MKEHLENIKTNINSLPDDTKLKQLLREKLNEIGILIYEYTSPMLTAVKKSGKNAQNNPAKDPSVTNIGVVTNHNCPDPKTNPSLFLNPVDSVGGFHFDDFNDQTIKGLNEMIRTESNNNRYTFP